MVSTGGSLAPPRAVRSGRERARTHVAGPTLLWLASPKYAAAVTIVDAPPATVPFWDRLATGGSAPALVTSDGEIGYAELAGRVRRLAERLGPTRRLVALEARNDVDTVVGLLACLVGATRSCRSTRRARRASCWRPTTPTSCSPPAGSPSGDRAPRTTSTPTSRCCSRPPARPGRRSWSGCRMANLTSNAAAIAVLPRDPPHRRRGHHAAAALLLRPVGGHQPPGRPAPPSSSPSCRSSTRASGSWSATPAVTTLAGVPDTFDLLDRGRLRDDGAALAALPHLSRRPARAGAVRRYADPRPATRLRPLRDVRRRPRRPRGWRACPRTSRPTTRRRSVCRSPAGRSRSTTASSSTAGANVMLGYADGPEGPRPGQDVTSCGPATWPVYARRPRGDHRPGRADRQGLRAPGGPLPRRADAARRRGRRVSPRTAVTGSSSRWTGRRGRSTRGSSSTPPACRPLPSRSSRSTGSRGCRRGSRTIRASGPLPGRRPGTGDGSTRHEGRFDLERMVARVLGLDDSQVRDTDSFVSLGGDSLSYVEMSLRLEHALGHLPPGWHLLSLAELASRSRARSRRGRTVETNVVLRALAIVMIVGSHSNLFTLLGGAHLLVGLAGSTSGGSRSPTVPAANGSAAFSAACPGSSCRRRTSELGCALRRRGTTKYLENVLLVNGDPRTAGLDDRGTTGSSRRSSGHPGRGRPLLPFPGSTGPSGAGRSGCRPGLAVLALLTRYDVVGSSRRRDPPGQRAPLALRPRVGRGQGAHVEAPAARVRRRRRHRAGVLRGRPAAPRVTSSPGCCSSSGCRRSASRRWPPRVRGAGRRVALTSTWSTGRSTRRTSSACRGSPPALARRWGRVLVGGRPESRRGVGAVAGVTLRADRGNTHNRGRFSLRRCPERDPALPLWGAVR